VGISEALDTLVRIGRRDATDKPQVVAVVPTDKIGEFLQRVEPPSSRDRRGRVIRSGARTDHGEQDAVDDLGVAAEPAPDGTCGMLRSVELHPLQVECAWAAAGLVPS
jgi:hypothetical protein